MSDRLKIQTFEFVQRISAMETPEDVCDAIEEELQKFGLEYITIMDVPHTTENQHQNIYLNSRPTEYVTRYIEENTVKIDPLITELNHTTAPYIWTDVKNRRDLSKTERFVIEEGKEFNMNDGYIIPVYNQNGKLSILSLGGEKPEFSADTLTALEMICLTGFENLKRAEIASSRKRMPKRLSNREREVMHWVAMGKTDDDIADILMVSTNTVSSHVQNSMRKLGAFKRTYAVVKAIKNGEIKI